MRCKVGDLVIICGGTKNIGKIAICLEYDPDYLHSLSGITGTWRVETEGSPLVRVGSIGPIAKFPDSWLRPIRPGDLEDESVTDVIKEQTCEHQ